MTHRITSGEVPTLGLRVVDYDRKKGTIIRLGNLNSDCGPYCNAWHDVQTDDGNISMMNCCRLTTRGI